jgi:hypothetical protein
MGYVREDGRTLMAQPLIDPPRLWTIDDIRRCRYEVVSPMRTAVGDREGPR